ncbi:MAG: NADH-quinone oxidoreductase subunit J [Deltaproteobacteria bacterium]|nr:NADH-quinone oxidoreductase subunit J [Deltaproteobacteria bacterium]
MLGPSVLFSVSATLAVFSTLMAMISRQAIHALLYFILSLLSLSLILFDLGAHFAAALELLIYAGAIMVLFLFVVMLLNPTQELPRKNLWLPGSLFVAFLAELIWLMPGKASLDAAQVINLSEVWVLLFKKYGVLVELSSFLLLAGLIAAYRIGRK